ncbi:MAG: ABC transporter permease [Maricaulaceae bacterium]
MFKIMWLRLWRDKGALVLAFILPGFIFAIFAAIFSNASGGQLDLRASLAVTSDAPSARAFAFELTKQKSFTVSYDESWTLDDIKERVRLGQDDAGIVLLGDIADSSKPSITFVTEPSRDVAATVLKGQVRQVLAEWAKEVAPEQANTASMPEIFTEVSALDAITLGGPSDQSVTYYIGATAILFLLFSAMQGAAVTLDERTSGISDRLLIGPKGALAMLSGKFLFLTLVGTIQAVLIVGVAYIFFGVPVQAYLLGLSLACVGSAALASAIALLTASLCASTAQMHTVSTFIVLLFSAIGGSMVPSFMMPDWLQAFGQFTPNAYAIDGFYGTLARGQSVIELLPVWSVLFGGAAICLLLAATFAHYMKRV